MRLLYRQLLYIVLISGLCGTLSADNTDTNEFCLAAKRREEQCGAYAFSIVRPLLDYFRKTQNKIDNYVEIIESKDSKIEELQNKLAELNTKLDDSRAAHILDLKSQTDIFKTTLQSNNQLSANASGQVTDLSRKITEQYTQILELKSQIEVKQKRFYACVKQLERKDRHVREKDEQIAILKTHKQYLPTTRRKIFEDSCLRFVNATGTHKIEVPGLDPFDVLCESTATGPGWIVIQQRINGKEIFFRDYESYRRGFGSFDGDFFLGLEKIHHLTYYQSHELYIHLEEFNGRITFAAYEYFAIAGENEQYKLINVDGFSGNTTSIDHLRNLRGNKFYTFDRDNSLGCAKTHYGGWWYGYCGSSNLNGKYFDNQIRNETFNYWYGLNSLKKIQMLIRPNLRSLI